MAYRDAVKTRLSKGILEMKFMKRSKDKVARLQESEEGQAAFSHLMTEGMKSQMGNIIVEPSYFRCAGLIEGRLSFKGVNPEIERLMELEERAKKIEETPHNETDVTDLEMAKYHSSLVKTMASKFATKRQKKNNNESNKTTKEHSDKTNMKPPKKKPKFLKPKDD